MPVGIVRIHGNLYRSLHVMIGYGFRSSWIVTLRFVI